MTLDTKDEPLPKPNPPASDIRSTAAHGLTMAALSDCGRRRKANQDRFLLQPELSLLILADGMGGANSGELAAEIAVASIAQTLAKSPTRDGAALSAALQTANELVFARGTEQEHSGMGTTAIAALVNDSELIAACVGDSRLYLHREGELRQLSRDHSRLQELIDEGFFTVRDSRRSGVGHLLTRAIGTKATVEPELLSETLQAGDTLLICSDGLSDLVDDWQLQDTLNDCQGNLDSTCRKLVDHANRNGGSDNITVLLARYDG